MAKKTRFSFSPDNSENPLWAGVQPTKITSSVRYRSCVADSGSILPENAQFFCSKK